MSDRPNTQKFNKLFIEYKSKILPKLRSDWETLSSDQQKKL